MHKRKKKKLNAPPKEINITKSMRVHNNIILNDGSGRGGRFSAA